VSSHLEIIDDTDKVAGDSLARTAGASEASDKDRARQSSVTTYANLHVTGEGRGHLIDITNGLDIDFEIGLEPLFKGPSPQL